MNSRKSKSFGWGIYIVQHTNTIPPFWCLKVKDNNTPTTFLYIGTIRVIFIQKSVYDTVRFFQFSISKCLSSLSLKWVRNVSIFEMVLKKIHKKYRKHDQIEIGLLFKCRGLLPHTRYIWWWWVNAILIKKN